MSDAVIELEDKLLAQPDPPILSRVVHFSTNGTGQRIYRIVTFSQWEVVPDQ